MIILDIVDQEEMEQAVKICQSIRLDEQSVKILLLVRPEPAAVRKRAVDTKSAGLADDFVFYDSSLTYLLAKLEALGWMLVESVLHLGRSSFVDSLSKYPARDS